MYKPSVDSLLLFSEDGTSTVVGLLVLGLFVLELGEGVASSGRAEPGSTLTGSTLGIPVSEVLELSGLGNVLLVVGLLLGGFFGTDLIVLASAEATWDVRLSSNFAGLELNVTADNGSELASRKTTKQTSGVSTYVLLGTSSILVHIRVGGEQVHAENLRKRTC